MSAMATRSRNSRATYKPMADLHDLVLIRDSLVKSADRGLDAGWARAPTPRQTSLPSRCRDNAPTRKPSLRITLPPRYGVFVRFGELDP